MLDPSLMLPGVFPEKEKFGATHTFVHAVDQAVHAQTVIVETDLGQTETGIFVLQKFMHSK